MCSKIYFVWIFLLLVVRAEEDAKNFGHKDVTNNSRNILPLIETGSYKNLAPSNFGLLYRSLQTSYLGSYLSIFEWPPLSWGRLSMEMTKKMKNEHSNNSEDGSYDDVKVLESTTTQSRGHDTSTTATTINNSLSSKRNNFTKGVDSFSLITSKSQIITYKQEEDKRPDKYNIYYNNYYRDCGQLRRRIKRIIGGHDSKIGSHPWQVALFKPTMKDKPYCGGALLSDRWIITAAHCIVNKTIADIKVRLGEYDVERNSEKLYHVECRIMRTEIHSEFSVETHKNDLALVQLDRIVYFDWHIVPVCLPYQNMDLIGRMATVTGWGRRVNNERKSSPAILNEVDIEVFPNQICEKWFTDAGHPGRIDDVFICAGWSTGGRDSCKGDSGGPLTTTVDGRNILIGIVSWGFGCGNKHSPGIYMNIQKYVPWIIDVIS